MVRRLLHQLGYLLQAPSKQKEGTQSPDRDAQSNYLNDTAVGFVKDGQPVISCDTKKERVGEVLNGGAEWHPAGEPTRTKTHDFIDKDLGRAVPYGVYDIENDEGWVQSATPQTPAPSPSRPSGAGGTQWASSASPTRTSC